jgi:hypothetical protein
MAMTPEGRVKKAVKEWLKARGIFFFMPVSNGMGQVGIPDFICCANGHFLAIETKAPGKRKNTTPNQDRVITEIHKSGGAAVVIDDVAQLEDIEAWRMK